MGILRKALKKGPPGSQPSREDLKDNARALFFSTCYDTAPFRDRTPLWL